jgi:hypothetical protein
MSGSSLKRNLVSKKCQLLPLNHLQSLFVTYLQPSFSAQKRVLSYCWYSTYKWKWDYEADALSYLSYGRGTHFAGAPNTKKHWGQALILQKVANGNPTRIPKCLQRNKFKHKLSTLLEAMRLRLCPKHRFRVGNLFGGCINFFITSTCKLYVRIFGKFKKVVDK